MLTQMEQQMESTGIDLDKMEDSDNDIIEAEVSGDSFDFIVGKQGKDFVKKLIESKTPEEFLPYITKKLECKIEELKFALPMLQACNIPLNTFYKECFGIFIEEIEKTIRHSAPKDPEKFEQLRKDTWKYLESEQLRVIPLTLAEVLPLPEHFSDVHTLVRDPKFASICPVAIKQKFWVKSPELLKPLIEPLIMKYITHEPFIKISNTMKTDDILERLVFRRNSQIVLDIANLFANNEIIYEMIMNEIKFLYCREGSAMYCDLRFDLLLLARDKNWTKIIEKDPILSFGSHLEAIVLSQSFIRKLPDLKNNIIQAINRSHKPIFGDISMLFRASWVIERFSYHFYSQFFNENGSPLTESLGYYLKNGCHSRMLLSRNATEFSLPSEDQAREVKNLLNFLKPLDKEWERAIGEQEQYFIAESDFMYIRSFIQEAFVASAHDPVSALLLSQYFMGTYEKNNIERFKLLVHTMEALIYSCENEQSMDYYGKTKGQESQTFVGQYGLYGLFEPFIYTLVEKVIKDYDFVQGVNESPSFLGVVEGFLIPLSSRSVFTFKLVLKLLEKVQHDTFAQRTDIMKNIFNSNANYITEAVEVLADYLITSHPIPAQITLAPKFKEIVEFQSKFLGDFAFQSNLHPRTFKVLEN